MPEFLAREHIAQMHLDEGHRNGEKGVAQGDARVREAARIDDDENDAVRACGLHPSDEFVLGVALSGEELMAKRTGSARERAFHLGERDSAVDPGSRDPSKIQVGSV